MRSRGGAAGRGFDEAGSWTREGVAGPDPGAAGGGGGGGGGTGQPCGRLDSQAARCSGVASVWCRAFHSA